MWRILFEGPVPEAEPFYPVPFSAGFEHVLVPIRLLLQINGSPDSPVVRCLGRAGCGHAAAFRKEERLMKFSDYLLDPVQFRFPASGRIIAAGANIVNAIPPCHIVFLVFIGIIGNRAVIGSAYV